MIEILKKNHTNTFEELLCMEQNCSLLLIEFLGSDTFVDSTLDSINSRFIRKKVKKIGFLDRVENFHVKTFFSLF